RAEDACYLQIERKRPLLRMTNGLFAILNRFDQFRSAAAANSMAVVTNPRFPATNARSQRRSILMGMALALKKLKQDAIELLRLLHIDHVACVLDDFHLGVRDTGIEQSANLRDISPI